MLHLCCLLTLLALSVISCHCGIVVFTLTVIVDLFYVSVLQVLASRGLQEFAKRQNDQVKTESNPRCSGSPKSSVSGACASELSLQGPSVRPKSSRKNRSQRVDQLRDSSDDYDEPEHRKKPRPRRGSRLYQTLLDVANQAGSSGDYLGRTDIEVENLLAIPTVERESKGTDNVVTSKFEGIKRVTVNLDGRNRIKARFKQHLYTNKNGFYISSLPQDCPFRLAGIELGDELLQMNDIPLAELDLDILVSMCEEYHLNKAALDINIQKSKSFCPSDSNAIMLEADMVREIKSKLKPPPCRQGIIFVNVAEGCPLYDAGVRDKDKLLGIGPIPASSLDVKSARRMLREACERRECVDIVVDRREGGRQNPHRRPPGCGRAKKCQRFNRKLAVDHLTADEDCYLSNDDDDGVDVTLRRPEVDELLAHSLQTVRTVTSRDRILICGGRSGTPARGNDTSIFVARKHVVDKIDYNANYPLPGDKLLSVNGDSLENLDRHEAVSKLRRCSSRVDMKVARHPVEPTSILFQSSLLHRRNLQENLWKARERKGSHPINGPDDASTFKLKCQVDQTMATVTYSFSEHTSQLAMTMRPQYTNLSREKFREYRRHRPNFDAPRSRFAEIDMRKILHKLMLMVTEAEPSLMGKVVGVGSHHDGTKVGKADEMDFVYILTHPDMRDTYMSRDKELGDPVKVYIHGEPTSDQFRHRFYSGEHRSEINSALLYEYFTRTVDSTVAQLHLPSHITFGGFDSPHFSGLRESGPAITLLFIWRGQRIALDITLAVYSPKLFYDVLQNVPKHVRQRLEHSVVPVSKKFSSEADYVLLIPSRGTGEWRATTTCLEVFYLQTYSNRSNLKTFMRFIKCFNSDYWTLAPDMMLLYRYRLSGLKKEVQRSNRTHMYKREYQLYRRRCDYETIVLYFVAIKMLEQETQEDFTDMKVWWKSKLQEESDIFKDFINPCLQDFCGEIVKSLVGLSSSVFKYVIMNMLMGRTENTAQRSYGVASSSSDDEQANTSQFILPSSGPVSDSFEGFSSVVDQILNSNDNWNSVETLRFHRWADMVDREISLDPATVVPDKCWHAFFGHPIPCRSYRTSLFGFMSVFCLLADKQYMNTLDEQNSFASAADFLD